MKKRTLWIAAGAAVVCLAVVAVLLAVGLDGKQYHCECGAKQYSGSNDTTAKDPDAVCSEGCDGTNLTWERLKLDESAQLPSAGNYYLKDDLTVSQAVKWDGGTGEAQTLRLDLNGNTLSNGAEGMFYLNREQTVLVITDTGKTGNGVITAEKAGTLLNVKAGTVRQFGGTVDASRAAAGDAKVPEKGGAILVEKGEYRLYGGTVTGGKAEALGGNVAVTSAEATFLMYGGVIEKGEITDGTDKYGSNVALSGGARFQMLGGEIRDGGAEAEGSNVFIGGSETNVLIGGTAKFSGEAKAIYLVGGTLEIGGGEFYNDIDRNSGTLNVSGGIFRQDVSAWSAEDAIVVRKPDGSYLINGPCVATVGKLGYSMLAEAVFDAAGKDVCIKLVDDYTSDAPLVITGDLYMDLNGNDLNCDVEVQRNALLTAYDSQTADFAVSTGANRDYGKINGKVTGELAMDFVASDSHRYLAFVHGADHGDGAGYSFHRIALDVNSVDLVPGSTAIGVETVFQCDEVAAGFVTNYGVSVKTADEAETAVDYGKPVLGSNNSKTYKTKEILSTANTVQVNNARADEDLTMYAFVELSGAEAPVKSAEVTKDFLQIVADANRALAGTTMTQAQIEELDKLYRTYRGVITAWDSQMEPIRNYSAKLYQVGYAAVNVDPTPDMYGKVGLMGYGNEATRLVTSVDSQSPLMAICLAITDSKGETVVLISVDSATVGGNVAKTIVSGVAAQCGVPEGHIMINSNHQHSTPVFGGVYDKHFTDQVISGVKQAMEDRKVVIGMDVQAVKVKENTYNFVRNRQYLDTSGNPIPGAMRTDNHDDKSRGDLVGRISSNVTYESTADNEVQLLKIARVGDEKDILLVNFQTHPHLGGGSSNTKATADIVGILRDRLDTRLNCRTMYFSGAGGNINPTGSNYIACGAGLATELAEGIDADKWVSAMGDATDGVGAVTKTYQYDVMLNSVPSWLRTTNKEFAGLSDAEILEKIVAHTYKFWDGSKYLVNSTSEDLNQYGIYSKYHAKYIQQRVTNKYGDTRSLTISTLSFGDIGFVVAPYEMFDTNGQELKTQSPFEMTFITTLADMPTAQRASLGNGYIPSALGYRNGGYSADISRYAAGTGEALVRDFLSMLHELKNR